MVLTRRQEAMLKKQYKIGEWEDESPPVVCADGRGTGKASADSRGDDPSTPASSRRRPSSSGQHTGLRSALKKYHTDRPWEERERRLMNNISIIDTTKRVRIGSENNEVFEFEKDPLSPLETDSDAEDEVKRRLYDEGGDGSDGSDGSDDDDEWNDASTSSEDDEDRAEARPRTKRASSSAAPRASSASGSSGMHDAMMAFLMLLLWSLSSSWLTVVMQSVLMHKRMSLPLMVPALSQLGCAIVVRLLDRINVVKLKPMPPVDEYVRKIVPLGLSTCTCMFLGNYAYIGLSLSFLSILKALTPAVTLVLAVIARMEKLSGIALLSTLLIAYGTGIAVEDEKRKDAEFHWASFVSFTTSVFFEASRVVFVSKNLKNSNYSSFDLLAGVGPLIFSVMATLSLFVERHTLLDLRWDEIVFISRTMVLIVALSFAVNISTYAAIKYSSSTTVKVVGCLKNTMIIWFGIIFQGDIVTKTQWEGFGLATAGFLSYALSRRENER